LIISQNSLWFVFTILITFISLILCILEWPESKIGIFANILILLVLVVLQWFDWIVLD